MSSYKRERAQRKPSLGIALCRRGPDSRGQIVPQVLLVRSRITYNFSSFVFGKYKPWDMERIMTLLAATTSEEKLLIWSCDFSRMWYHIWQHVPEPQETDTFYQFYINSRAKFERLIQRDNGRRLRGALGEAPSVQLGWDIPGGRAERHPDGTEETELETAQREMREESGIAASDYHMIWGAAPICDSFEDDNVVWIRKYYVAWTDKKIEPRMNYNSLCQIGEVSEVRWVGLRDLRDMVAQNRCLTSQVRRALALFRARARLCSE